MGNIGIRHDFRIKTSVCVDFLINKGKYTERFLINFEIIIFDFRSSQTVFTLRSMLHYMSRVELVAFAETSMGRQTQTSNPQVKTIDKKNHLFDHTDQWITIS